MWKFCLSKICFVSLVVTILVFCSGSEAEAKWIWSSETGFVNPDEYELGNPKELYARAERLFNEKNYSEASKEFARIANFSRDVSYRKKSAFMSAESLYMSEDYYTAYEMFEEFVSLYGTRQSPELISALKREMDCAFMLIKGKAKKKILGIPLLSLKAKGIAIVRSILEEYPFYEFSEEYYLQFANTLFEAEEYDLATTEFENFVKIYTTSYYAPKAKYLIGLSYYMAYKGTDFSIEPLKKAEIAFTKYLDENPDGNFVSEAQKKLKEITEKIAEKEFTTAIFYLKKKSKLKSAEVYLKSIIDNYPETHWAQKAKELLEKISKNNE